MARYLCCNGEEWEVISQNGRDGFTVPELEECLRSRQLYVLNLKDGRMVCTRTGTIFNEEASKIVEESVKAVTPHLSAFRICGDAIYCEKREELWREPTRL